jgi:hypothetical protein
MTETDVKINWPITGEQHHGSGFMHSNMTSLNYYNLVKKISEVTVAKHSANASVNEAERKADFWIFGHLRPVFLEVLHRNI